MSITGAEEITYGPLGGYVPTYLRGHDRWALTNTQGDMEPIILHERVGESEARQAAEAFKLVSPHVACITLNALYSGVYGYRPSHFYGKLLELFATGDTEHQAALSKGYPGIGAAYWLYHSLPGGTDLLIARSKEPAS